MKHLAPVQTFDSEDNESLSISTQHCLGVHRARGICRRYRKSQDFAISKTYLTFADDGR